MNIFQIENKKFAYDPCYTCHAIRKKEAYGDEVHNIEFFAIRGEQAEECRKKKFSIVRVVSTKFSLTFDFNGLKTADDGVDAKFSFEFKIIPNQEFAEFIQKSRVEKYTDEDLKKELLSSHWDLTGLIRRYIADTKNEMLIKYGKDAIDWKALKVEMPSWIDIVRMESLTATPEVKAKIEDFNRQMKNIDSEKEATQKKLREPIDIKKAINETAKFISFCGYHISRRMFFGTLLFFGFAVVTSVYSWIDINILQTRVGLEIVVGEDERDDAICRKLVVPAVTNLVGISNAAITKNGNIIKITAEAMRKKDRFAFAGKAIELTEKYPSFINWEGGAPAYVLDEVKLTSLLKKSEYRLIINSQKIAESTIDIYGYDTAAIVEIDKFLKMNYKVAPPKEIIDESGREVIKYTARVIDWEIHNEILPFFQKRIESRDGKYEPAKNRVTVNLPQTYIIDVSNIANVSRKNEVKEMLKKALADMFEVRGYQEDIFDKFKMLEEKGFLPLPLGNEEKKTKINIIDQREKDKISVRKTTALASAKQSLTMAQKTIEEAEELTNIIAQCVSDVLSIKDPDAQKFVTLVQKVADNVSLAIENAKKALKDVQKQEETARSVTEVTEIEAAAVAAADAKNKIIEYVIKAKSSIETAKSAAKKVTEIKEYIKNTRKIIFSLAAMESDAELRGEVDALVKLYLSEATYDPVARTWSGRIYLEKVNDLEITLLSRGVRAPCKETAGEYRVTLMPIPRRVVEIVGCLDNQDAINLINKHFVKLRMNRHESLTTNFAINAEDEKKIEETLIKIKNDDVSITIIEERVKRKIIFQIKSKTINLIIDDSELPSYKKRQLENLFSKGMGIKRNDKQIVVCIKKTEYDMRYKEIIESIEKIGLPYSITGKNSIKVFK